MQNKVSATLALLALAGSAASQDFCPAVAAGFGVGYPGDGDTCNFRPVQDRGMPEIYRNFFVLAASQDFYNQRNTQFDFKLDCDTRVGISCGKSCGECVEITGPAGTNTYFIQEICDAPVVGQSCFGPTVNLNVGQQHSSDVLIGLAGGQNIQYRKVPCPVTGNIKVWLPESGSNPFSLAITPFNYRVGVARLEIRGRADATSNPNNPADWLELPREWTNKFAWRPVASQPDHVQGQPQIPLSNPFDVRLTSINGEQVICPNVLTNWQGGQFTVHECQGQFAMPNCATGGPSSSRAAAASSSAAGASSRAAAVSSSAAGASSRAAVASSAAAASSRAAVVSSAAGVSSRAAEASSVTGASSALPSGRRPLCRFRTTREQCEARGECFWKVPRNTNRAARCRRLGRRR